MSELSTKPRASLYQRITDQIISELERGTVPWHKPWSTATLSKRVVHPRRHSGERYRGINIISLWMAATASGFVSPYWMTYRQALALGGQVRKGEKGALVMYSGTLTKDAAKAEEAEASDQNARDVRFQRSYCVFNADQIEGLPAHFMAVPDGPRFDPPARDARAEAFLQALGADVRHGGSQAFYAEGPDYIRLPPFECFEDAVAYYGTRNHETVHWTGHKSRLDRRFDAKRFPGPAAYAMEELVAELGAAFLGADLEVTPQPGPNHAAYIEHWLQVFKGDNRAIFTAAAHAQRACDYLHALQPKSDG